MIRVRLQTVVLTTLVLVALAAGPLVPQVNAWNLSSNPGSRTTTPGGTVTYTISVFYQPPEAVVGQVQLLVSPPELGLTPSFSPSTGNIPFSSTLTVQVSATKAPGTYSIPVWAHPTAVPFPGPSNKAINVQLVVQAAAQTDWDVSNPTFTPPSPNVGDAVTFHAGLTVLSTNQAFPQSVSVLATVDGIPVGGGTVTHPGPTGIPATVSSAPPWTATPGTHTLVWTVTSASDPNLANNQISRVFAVNPPPAQFDFEILASPTDRTVTPGGSVSYTIITNLLSGTTQSVVLSLSGQPGGVTESFSPSSGSPGFSSSLNLNVASSVTTGTYTMTVTGAGGGKTHTATIRLTVTQAPDLRIDLSPPSVTASQGQVASYSVSVVGMNGFNSQVSLSVSGAPAGVTPVFSVSSGTPNFNSILTISLPSAVQTGSFSLVITASGGGITKIANVVLIITAATGTQTQTQTQTRTETETETTASAPTFDLLKGNNLLMIAVLAIVIAALLLLLLRRRGTPPPPPPSNPCPKCGQPLMFVKEYDRWYCNDCKEYK